MRVRLGGSVLVLACLVASGCGDDDEPQGDDRAARAAEALSRAMRFTGGELRDGAMELASEDRVEVVLASEQVMTPGRGGLMALGVDNPIEDDKPARATLMQFGDVEEHVRVPTDESVEGEGDLNFEFELGDDVCEGLCAERIEVPITIALELKGGDVSKHLKAVITVDCRDDGDEDACEDSGSAGRGGSTGNAGRGGTGGTGGSVPISPGATAAVEDLLDTLDEFEGEVCACIGGADGDVCASESVERRSCNEVVLLAFAEGNQELIECVQVYFEDQHSCVTAAACDLDAIELCSAASEDDNWAAIEMQCGTVPVVLRTGIDACSMGGAPGLTCPGGTPLAVDARCDGTADCSDGSDELGCDPGNPSGRPTDFPCMNGSILELDLVCDGANDCPDGFDEMVCVACPDGSGMFSAFDQCDGEMDCASGSDEAGCMFPCTNGEMVMIQTLCNGTPDCSDGSDESFCMGGNFTCPDGEMIPVAQVCDGSDDCSDGGDESPNLCQ